MSSTEPVEVVGTGLVSSPGGMTLPVLARKFLDDVASAAELTGEQAELAILAQILSGASIEDIFGMPATLAHIKDMVGEDITVHAYRWQRSDFDSFPVYMVLTVSDSRTDGQYLASCGSKACMAQVYAAAEHGLLPCDVTVAKAAKPTKDGYYPMRFVTTPPPFAD